MEDRVATPRRHQIHPLDAQTRYRRRAMTARLAVSRAGSIRCQIFDSSLRARSCNGPAPPMRAPQPMTPGSWFSVPVPPVPRLDPRKPRRAAFISGRWRTATARTRRVDDRTALWRDRADLCRGQGMVEAQQARLSEFGEARGSSTSPPTPTVCICAAWSSGLIAARAVRAGGGVACAIPGPWPLR